MPLRVLVIDDDVHVCMTTTEMLEMMGHKAAWAPDVVKGLALAKAQEFDLVITDIMMPGKLGFEAILEVKNCYPASKVIAMSGGVSENQEAVLAVASRLGADLALPKPFTYEQLRAAVDSVTAGM
jgi:DNA-binding response OmpR family regulator